MSTHTHAIYRQYWEWHITYHLSAPCRHLAEKISKRRTSTGNASLFPISLSVPLSPSLCLSVFLKNKLYIGHMRYGPFHPVALFGDAVMKMAYPRATEAATDDVARLLLRIGNCDTATMIPFSQQSQYKVKFGSKSFASIPDATFAYRFEDQIKEGPTFIVVDKQLGADDGEYQIPGEMLAAAYHNFMILNMDFTQTIFAMRLIGTFVAFYHADFPKSYLESVRSGQRPSEHLTIFRVGGNRAKKTKQKGFGIMEHGEQRVKAFTILCSIVNTCNKAILPSWVKREEPPITSDRLARLANTFSL